MKKTHPVMFSLRKFLIAILAVGPIAILPTPVWANIPTTSNYTVTSGSVTLSTTTASANLSSSDRAVLVWTSGSFTINSSETFSFNLPAGGAVLNKVGYATSGALATATDSAVINGTLFSNGRVFVLANGNINIGSGANLNTSGLTLSTLQESSDFNFTTTGNLALNGSSLGSVNLGNATAANVTVTGGMAAYGGTVTTNNISVTGDMLVNQSGSGTSYVPVYLNAAGNLTITTNNGTIANSGLGAAQSIISGNVASLTAGAAAITVNNPNNDFKTLSVSNSGSLNNVSIKDANIITLGASSVGGNLDVAVGGNVNTTGIQTSGAVAVGGSANLTSQSSANSGISFQNGSSVAGTLSALTAGGAITINTTGNLTVGNITSSAIPQTLSGTAYNQLDSAVTATSVGVTATLTAITATTAGAGNVTAAVLASAPGPIYTGNQTVSFISPIATANATVGVATFTVSGAAATTSFTSVPTLTFSTGGASGTVTLSAGGTGTITGITVTAAGAYTAAPTITISGGGITTATGLVIPTFTLASIALATTASGSTTVPLAGAGYTSIPTVSVVGGGMIGTAPTLTATLASALTATQTAALSGVGISGVTTATYSSIPGVLIQDSTHDLASVTATASAVLGSNGLLGTTLTIGNAGAGYGSNTPAAILPAVTTIGSTGKVIGGAVAVTTSGVLTTALGGLTAILSGGTATFAGINSGASATLRGSSIVTGANIQTSNSTSSATFNSTAGGITIGAQVSASAVTVNAVGGNISESATTGFVTTGNAGNTTSVFTAVGNVIDLTGANNTFSGNSSATQPIQVTANNAIIAATGNIVIGTTNVTNNLTVATATTSGGTLTALNKNIILGTGLGVGVGQNLTVAGTTTVTTAGGTVSDNAYSALTLTGPIFITSGNGNVTINASTTTTAPKASFGQVNVNAGTGSVIVGQTTDMNVGNITAANLTANATGGNMTQSGNVTLTATGTFIAGTNGTILMNGTNNAIPTVNVVGGANGSVSVNGNTTIGSSTSSAGNLTIASLGTGNNVSLAAFTTTGNLTVNSANAIDIQGNVTIGGNLTLNASGNFSAASAKTITDSVIGANIAAGNITNATSNVTGIGTNTGSLNVMSYAIAPSVAISAPLGVTTTATASMALDTLGRISTFTISSAAGSGYNSALLPTVTLGTTSTPNASITESTGTLAVTGTTSISSPGNALLWRNNDFTGNVILNNTSGGVVVTDVNNLTVSGLALGAVQLIAGVGATSNYGVSATGTTPSVVANAWNLTLGNLTANTLTARAQNGGGGNSGTITQASGTALHVDNLGTFVTSNGNIVLANAGNSVGPVSLTAGTASVTYAEDATVKLNTLSLRGNASITARTGSIIEDTTNGSSISDNGTLTLNATGGSITIGNTTQTTASTTGNLVTVVANAPSGTVAVQSTGGNFTLGNIAANSLSVTATTGNILQSGSLNIYGSATFKAPGDITLGGTNNFGPIIINSTGSGNVTVNESGTMNLRTVAMGAGSTGNFSASSANGDIISTGFGGVRPGGTTAAPGSGLVSLTALNGNITVGDATADFPTTAGVVFNGNNVSLNVLGNATLALGNATTAARATGNLTVVSVTGNIANTGNISVGGLASFQTGIGNISLNQSGDSFGTLKFVGSSVSIIQTGDMKILTGSSATGAASLASTGSISIVNSGGTISFGNTVSLTATNNITLPKLLTATGTITVNAAGTKDLSALSIGGDLSGKTPTNLGTGAYSAPQP